MAAGSSTGSSAASFHADPGPEFDPKAAPPAPEAPADERVLLEQWEEKQVKEFLELKGEVMHAFLAATPEDQDTWLYTERDLRAIAPPLTRILNRYDTTRAAAVMGDEALVAGGFIRYGSRNYIKRRRYLAQQAAQGPQPITGVEAEPETGPEFDPDWQRVTADPLGGAPPAITPKGTRR